MTTILSVRRNGKTVMGGDGQATLGNIIIKKNCKKVKYMYNNKIIAGFAGSTSDSFKLFEIFEKKLEINDGKLIKAAVELAKDWRNDKILRKLETFLAVVDKKNSLIITGYGDIIKPEYDLIGIGSGGTYALAAARVLIENTKFNARIIVEKSLKIASDICIYTNKNLIIKELN
ncbi:MAG: ATP-dependent protease subunit HslV [Enterobacteriaceae bacterium PSpicST2]|nr:MAG: ATP-dependent protease subunit HslV [Enterobacteriaceae bacterium PSpicST2]WMC18996.1 MAG: ATP-dependent protease subunit HslV [Enterobacteriaceae bacterium PSpicST1]